MIDATLSRADGNWSATLARLADTVLGCLHAPALVFDADFKLRGQSPAFLGAADGQFEFAPLLASLCRSTSLRRAVHDVASSGEAQQNVELNDVDVIDGGGRTVDRCRTNIGLLGRDGTQAALLVTLSGSTSVNSAAGENRALQAIAAADHDLRQPMLALRLLASAVRASRSDDERARIADDIDRTIEVAQRMIGDLLAMAGPTANTDAGNASPVPANHIIDALTLLFRNAASAGNIDLRFVGCSRLVMTDTARLARLIGNFVANALRHSNGTKVLVGCRRRGPTLRFEVWDDGIGIESDHLAALLTGGPNLPPQQIEAATAGGLGIAIARTLSRDLGHRIDGCSETGRGTKFAVNVPLAAPADTGD